MFEVVNRRTKSRTAFQLLELIFHWTVREMTTASRYPIMAFINQIFQLVVMVAVFFGMFQLLGMRGSAIRGDFILYLMSGIFCFICHTKSIGAVMGADGPLSAMMQHAPMTTAISILSSALAALFQQIISGGLILFFYNAYTGNVEFHQFLPALGMFLLSWFSGCCIGLVLMSVKPYMPRLTSSFGMVYRRANMLFSGKMFLANSIPGYMLPVFSWNPLFHIIDQCRGYTFINYNPHFTTWKYPLYVGLALLVIGMMAEFSSRRNVSASSAKTRA